ncbi:MAG: DUF2834 domain-containing protein [Parvibaculum sp.]|nr:DUF2834 domain-containing protein [Parvibaculum sp.]
MSGRFIALILVIAGFGALSAMALLEVGYIGIFEQHLQNWAGMQVLTDLVIVCLLAMIWMVQDARKSGITVWPFLVMTLALGSFGPLFYLAFRELRAPASVMA